MSLVCSASKPVTSVPPLLIVNVIGMRMPAIGLWCTVSV